MKYLAIISFFLPFSAFAAITMDSNGASTSHAADAGGNWSFSVTINNSAAFLVVSCWGQTGTNQTITSPKFNGTTMAVTNDYNWNSTGNGHTYDFTLVAPSVTTANFTAVTSANGTVACNYEAFDGVDQVNPIDANTATEALSTSIKTTLTPTHTGDVYYSHVFNNDGTTITGSTNVVNSFTGYNATVHKYGDSIGNTLTSGVGNDMQWSFAGSTHGQMGSIVMAPAAAAVVPPSDSGLFWSYFW